MRLRWQMKDSGFIKSYRDVGGVGPFRRHPMSKIDVGKSSETKSGRGTV